MTLVSQFTLAKDPLWNYTTLLAWIMVELVVSIIAACAPTLSYLLPKSMTSRHQPSQTASKLSGHHTGGIASRLSKNEYAVKGHKLDSDDTSSEEDERRIIVKEDIEMKWQGGASGSGSGSQTGSMTSWYDENNGKSGPIVYDGRDHGSNGTRTWVTTSEMGRSGSNRANGPSHAL